MDSKLSALRAAMKTVFDMNKLKNVDLDYYIIPHNDQHMSEYTCPEDERIKYISNFSGSAGTIIVGRHEAYLWIDGRYHIQADSEVDLNIWTVMKFQAASVPNWQEWLKTLPTNTTVGYNPKLFL